MERDPSPPAAGLAQRLVRPALAFAHRRPFISFALIVVLSNAVGSYFNITYNRHLIVEHYLNAAQKTAFWKVLVIYNSVAYSAALVLILCFLLPLARSRRWLRAGSAVAPERLEASRRLLINLPLYQVSLNFLAWIPGAVLFPLGICLLGGWEEASAIWLQFGISFIISALLTSMQTFFVIEAFLIEVLYPDFFRDARPAEVRGALRVSFGWRVFLLWSAIAVVPLLALLVVALNFTAGRLEQIENLRWLAAGVSTVGLPFSAFLMWMVGRNLLSWVRAHTRATQAIAGGDFKARVSENRPDEWGLLTDRFNDMASALEEGERLRETFGQFVSPEVRDEVLARHPGLGGTVEEVTVLFTDIRGFTRRSAGEPPERAVDLLNRFLTLCVAAVEENGGWVNKFLGDGILALFGTPRPREDHAELAVRAARDLLERLGRLNSELAAEGREPLQIGIGIHTGPALVGCIGASPPPRGGVGRVRREFTAIGETVNVAQRLEALTKVHGGPILASDVTFGRLRESAGFSCLGPVALPGREGTLVVHRG